MILMKRALIWLRRLAIYTLVNARRYFVEMPQKRKAENHLLRKGFIKYDSKLGAGLAEYLGDIIENPAVAEMSSLGHFKILQQSEFGMKSIAVDASSEFLHKYVFTEELFTKLRDFYGKPFFLRNNPTIEFSYDGEENNAQLFHLDWGLKQSSVMFNLSDLDKSATHMEYIIGSNRQYKFTHPSRFSNREVKRARWCQQNLPLETTIGKTGQVSVFDAGCGYHRQIGGGRRVMLHLNFTENLAFTNWSKDWSPDNAFYWFAKHRVKSDLKIANRVFDIVNKDMKPGFLVPKIISK